MNIKKPEGANRARLLQTEGKTYSVHWQPEGIDLITMNSKQRISQTDLKPGSGQKFEIILEEQNILSQRERAQQTHEVFMPHKNLTKVHFGRGSFPAAMTIRSTSAQLKQS